MFQLSFSLFFLATHNEAGIFQVHTSDTSATWEVDSRETEFVENCSLT